MNHAVDIKRIVDGLAARIESLARELMPAGRRQGAEWVDADAPAGKGSTLSVHLGGCKAGVWSHFSTGIGGDALDLVAYVKFAGDKKQAYHWAVGWLGLFEPRKAGAARPAPRQHAAPAPETPSHDDEQVKAERKRKWALAQFLAAQESLRGTAAEWYLRARAIDLARLDRQPGALRFAPRTPYPASVMPAAGDHPALLAAITDVDGTFLAVHRTFLEVLALGRAAKLSIVPKAKIVTGRYAGGLVRVWHGQIANDETGEIKEAPKLGELEQRRPALRARGWHGAALEEIHLTEGIENALSLACGCPSYRVAAAVSSANLGRVRLPEAIARVVIWADADAAGSSAARSLERAIAWHTGHGKRVEIVRMPPGFKDVNDYWRSVA